jgi:two-component system, OmpR family, sensor kinase
LSLRARLLLGLVVLAGIGLGVAAAATYEEQRSFLFRRVDQEVAASELPVSVGLGLVKPPRGVGPRPVPRVSPAGTGFDGRGPVTIQASGTYGELLSGTGQVLKVRSFTYGQSPPSPPALARESPLSHPRASRIRLFTVNAKNGALRYRAAAFSLSGGRVLVIAVPLREVDQILHRLLLVEGLVGGGMILALILLGWIVIRISMRPLERIERVANDIAHGDLSRRVPPSSPRTEIGRLGLSLNEMLAQIEQAFADRRESEDRLRHFLADASHELRTPLAAIRGYAEVFRLGAAQDPEALARAMSRIESEAARMGVLVEDLLMLASLDELPDVRRVPVDLPELAAHAADDARAIAPDRAVRVFSESLVRVRADSDQLRQVLGNLMRNAIVHTPAGTPIEITVGHDAGSATLTVRDRGPGLPPGPDGQVFQRFWRSEGGRARGPSGAGLGLAIVTAIVAAHHGTVQARNASGGGAEFVVCLPLLSEAAADATNQRQPAPEPVAPRS